MSGLKRALSVVVDEQTDDLLRVAFASSDQQLVDQHFGTATQFVIYGISPERASLLSLAEFDALGTEESEAKLAEKLDILDQCVAVYCRACGASGVRRLLDRGIQPVKVVEGAEITELLQALQDELKQGPSTWLAKAMQKNTLNFSRFNDMEIEGWKE